MGHAVFYTPRALRHLANVFDYINEHAGAATARRYTRKIELVCESLESLALRGLPRADIRSGLRTVTHRRRFTIAYSVEAAGVIVHGIFQAGQDYEKLLRELDEE